MNTQARARKSFPAAARAIFACAVFVLIATRAASADPPCQLGAIKASLALETDADGTVTVPVMVQDRPARLMVDTGAVASVLDMSFAHAAGRDATESRRRGVMLGGGILLRDVVNVETVKVGPVVTSDFTFIAAPSAVLSHEFMGMLGTDIMGGYDVEIDFAGETFKMLVPDQCPGQVVYWTHQPYAQIPIVLDQDRHIMVSVLLDGKPITAIIDTGAGRSFMSMAAAKELFGIDQTNRNSGELNWPD